MKFQRVCSTCRQTPDQGFILLGPCAQAPQSTVLAGCSSVTACTASPSCSLTRLVPRAVRDLRETPGQRRPSAQQTTL